MLQRRALESMAVRQAQGFDQDRRKRTRNAICRRGMAHFPPTGVARLEAISAGRLCVVVVECKTSQTESDLSGKRRSM